MRLLSITLSGYRQFLDPVTLEIPDGITGICGPNGVGKSKLVEAIGYALYGVSKGILPKGDKASDLASRAGQNVKPKVTLWLEINGQHYELIRSGSSRQCVLRLEGDTNALAETTIGVTNKMIELLRLTPDAFLATFVARQREIASLQSLNSNVRERLVNRLIGISLAEKAMQMAQARRQNAKSAFEAAESVAGERVEEVQARLEASRRNQQEAAEKESMAKIAYQAAQTEEESTQRHWETMKTLSEQHARKREQIEGAETLMATLREAVNEATARVEKIVEAETAIALARKSLVDTERIDEAIACHEIRATLAQERQKQVGIQEDLTTVIQQLAEKERILSEQAAVESEIMNLQYELQAYVGPLAALGQELQSAQADEQQRASRKRYVYEKGPGGVCDQCGQRLGDNLDLALEHLEAERQEAQERIEAAKRAISEQTQAEKTLQKKLENLSSQKKAILERLKPYASLSDERIRLETLLEGCSERIAGASKDGQDAPYEPDVHKVDQLRQQRRREAERTISTYSRLASEAEEARQALSRYQQHLEEKTHQLEALQRELAAVAVDSEAITQADENYRTARQNSGDLLHILSLAQSEIVRTKAQVEEIEREVEQARKRWQGIRERETTLRVAERTADLMRQLLIEISSEARPRITELMEGWAQALMGPQFQHIELTDNYRICADNGSGLHEIEHFSGGEQTLLALMLRVAISLYCQERAGYPAGVLILDEVFGDQDENHRTQLVQFLEEIRPNYHQILVVNHVSEVTEMLNSIITVTPVGECQSTAALQR